MKTITVKGIGNVSLTPDFVEIHLKISDSAMQYSDAMEKSAKSLDALRARLSALGFDGKALKTVDFYVETQYRYPKNKRGETVKVFDGYRVVHRLLLEFDFSAEQINKALSALSCNAEDPDLRIKFTVKDKNAAKEDLLRSAVENALAKAKILTAAAGVKLGALSEISYFWGELDIYSPMNYCADYVCAAPEPTLKMDITPTDIDLSDSVTVIWEIA